MLKLSKHLSKIKSSLWRPDIGGALAGTAIAVLAIYASHTNARAVGKATSAGAQSTHSVRQRTNDGSQAASQVPNSQPQRGSSNNANSTSSAPTSWASLSNAYIDCLSSNLSLSTYLDETRTRLNGASNALEMVQCELSGLQGQYDFASDKVTTLTSSNAYLLTRLGAARADLDSKARKLTDLMGFYDSEVEKNESLSRSNVSLMGSNSSLRGINYSLADKLKNTEDQTRRQAREIKRQAGDISSLSGSNNQLKANLNKTSERLQPYLDAEKAAREAERSRVAEGQLVTRALNALHLPAMNNYTFADVQFDSKGNPTLSGRRTVKYDGNLAVISTFTQLHDFGNAVASASKMETSSSAFEDKSKGILSTTNTKMLEKGITAASPLDYLATFSSCTYSFEGTGTMTIYTNSTGGLTVGANGLNADMVKNTIGGRKK